jgi:RimJ/RimL family protein N-acetyltransferase
LVHYAENMGLPILAVVRPDNRPSVKILEALEFEPVGTPADYSVEMQDNVEVARQMYRLTK